MDPRSVLFPNVYQPYLVVITIITGDSNQDPCLTNKKLHIPPSLLCRFGPDYHVPLYISSRAKYLVAAKYCLLRASTTILLSVRRLVGEAAPPILFGKTAPDGLVLTFQGLRLTLLDTYRTYCSV